MRLSDWWYDIRTKRIREKKLAEKSLKASLIKRESVCNFKGCKKKLNLINTYHCPYCDKDHCETHRIPEKHECESPRLPYGMRKFGSKTQRNL
ncbi:MAG: AN1-type zinc finger domain-containing protein [Bacteroidetes bacterium]|nr:AN1-type zinc finger domain-containing protein [Bacteroidota bacterium]